MSSQWRSKKLLQRFVSHELRANLSVFDLFLNQWIKVILSNECKPDNFESHFSLKLSSTNICSFCSNFVECESFLELNTPDVLALCEANLDDSKVIINKRTGTSKKMFVHLFWAISPLNFIFWKGNIHVLHIFNQKTLRGFFLNGPCCRVTGLLGHC